MILSSFFWAYTFVFLVYWISQDFWCYINKVIKIGIILLNLIRNVSKIFSLKCFVSFFFNEYYCYLKYHKTKHQWKKSREWKELVPIIWSFKHNVS